MARPRLIAWRGSLGPVAKWLLGQVTGVFAKTRGSPSGSLAEQIGTQSSAISRIEDADYDRHSIGLLERVAEALDVRLIIDFEPREAGTRRKAKG